MTGNSGPAVDPCAGLAPFKGDRNNPYIGPRPFTRADAPFFKGRDEEIAILEGLVLSKRVVLFFAQSGAGKSSLLEAGLIPRLIEKHPIGRGKRARHYQKMQVLPTMSVGGSFAPGAPLPEKNIFVHLALSSLFPDADRQTIESYDSLSAGVKSYLAGVDTEGLDVELSGNILLIFDQFEELFTRYPERGEDRARLFEQINEALDQHPRWHVLFTMREDYIAEMVPYGRLLPDNLRTRYRLERLKEENALQAVVEPACLFDTRYAAGVAEELVRNLGRIQLGKISAEEAASLEETMPLLVEPVHLQIVCRQLWENLPPGKTPIQDTDVQAFGDVDEALKGFYNGIIRRVLDETDSDERHLRAWFSDDLITSSRTRALFYHDDIGEAHITNEAVAVLRQAYIIRRIKRGVDNWYELAHDRMVDPILTANEKWNAGYMQRNPLAAAYAVYLNDASFLLRGEQLDKAKKYAHENPHELIEEERDYLQECIDAADARRRRRNWTIAGVTAVVIFGIAMGLLALYAYNQKLKADAQTVEANRQREIAVENEQLARSRELAADALNSLDEDPELSILLALQGLELRNTPEAENALRQAMQRSRIARRFSVDGQAFRSVAVDPEGTRLAAVGEDGLLRIWDLQDPNRTDPLWVLPERSEPETEAPIYAVVFNPQNPAQVVTAHQDGMVKTWEIERGEQVDEEELSDYALFDLAYTADGGIITASPADHAACCGPDEQSYNQPYALDVAVSPDGRWLATAGRRSVDSEAETGQVKIWDLQDDALVPLPIERLDGHTDTVWAVAFSPDGQLLASGGEDKTVIVWDISGLEMDGEPQIVATHFDHTNTISDLTFSSNGRCLISAGLDRTTKVWDTQTGQLLYNLAGHTDRVHGVDVAGSQLAEDIGSQAEICGQQLATVSDDGTVRLWDLGAAAEVLDLSEHSEPVESVDFDSGGEKVVTAGDDGRVILWDTRNGTIISELIDPDGESNRAHDARVNRAIFSPGDELIATAGWDDIAKLWNLGSGTPIPLEGHTGQLESVDFNEAGTLLATASDDGTARIWSTSDGACLQTFVHATEGSGDTRKVYGVRFHPLDEYLVTTGGDGFVRAWQLDEAILAGEGSCAEITEAALTIEPDEECANNPASCTVNDAAFNENGTQLATVAWNAQVKLRDFPSGDLLSEFSGHTKRVYGVQFDPDQLELVTSSADGTVRIWDLETGQVEQVLPGPEFNYLDISDDGRYLAVAGEDGSARIYALELDDLVKRAQDRLTRHKLTPEECQRYALQDSAVCQ